MGKFRYCGVCLGVAVVVALGCGDNFLGGGDTNPVPVVPVPIRDWRAAWNPVRDVIAYEHTPVTFYDPVDSHSKLPGIYVINADGTNDSLVIYGGSYPSWSPSGDTIAYISQVDGDLYIRSVATGADTRLTSIGELQYTSFSTDGKTIAVSTRSQLTLPSRIFLIDISSVTLVRIGGSTPYAAYNWTRPRWMPNEPRLVFELSGSLYFVDALTQELTELRSGCAFPAVSAGGDSVCFRVVVGQFQTIVLSLSSGKEVRIGQRLVECFSRDGMNVIHSSPRRVVSGGIPKDKYFLFTYDLKTGRDVQLTR